MESWPVAIRVYLSTPELISASIWLAGGVGTLVLLVGGICWHVRGQSAVDNEKALTSRLALANDQSGILEKKVSELTQQVVDLKQRIEGYVKVLRSATIPVNPEQNVFINSLINQTATLTDSVKSIARSSHELGTTLTEPPWTQLRVTMRPPKGKPSGTVYSGGGILGNVGGNDSPPRPDSTKIELDKGITRRSDGGTGRGSSQLCNRGNTCLESMGGLERLCRLTA
jgi:hypothetical protein